MGCDIHAYIEIKDPEEKRDWSLVTGVDIGRWYTLFGAMAGARDDEIEHIPPRGVPYDSAWLTREYYREWEPDTHHASWLTTDEFAQAIERVRAHGGTVMMDMVLAMMQKAEALGRSARIVFWFDN